MAYSKKEGKSKQNIIDETLDLFDKYSSKRDTWAQQAKDCLLYTSPSPRD